MKKVLSLLMATVMILTSLFALNIGSFAASNTVSVKLSKDEYSVGDTIKAYITVTGKISGLELKVEYDKDTYSVKKCDSVGSQSFNNNTGVLHFAWAAEKDKNYTDKTFITMDIEVIGKGPGDIIVTVLDAVSDENSNITSSFSVNNKNIFPDVNYSEWYYKAVKFNAKNGYFNGYANGYFGPADKLQRQDFIINLAKIANADLNAYKGVDCGLSDVSKDAYYSSAVAWSVKNSVVGGYQDGRFGVSDSITREQICVILYKYMANYLGEDVSLSEDTQTILSKFSDKDNISSWAVTSVAWAVENGIVGGGAQTSVNPLGNATRAEVAQIFMNMSNNGLI